MRDEKLNELGMENNIKHFVYLVTPEYKREHHFYFDTFDAANEFYVKMADRLSLTHDTYRNERYVQLVNDNAPKFTKQVYLDLITNFNIF